MRGRRPVPAEVQALRGNPGKRPLAAAASPPQDLADLVAPDWLAPEGLAEWDRITAALAG